MSHPKTPAEHRDERAADRDDAADRRDDAALGRDDKADRRDIDATERDAQARRDSDDLIARFRRTCEQILDRFARIEDTTIDPDDWPDLTPDALARLDAHAAEQRRLAALDREAVTALLDQLRTDLDHARRHRHDAAADRLAAADDRHDSADDRGDSHRDRSKSAVDRAQSAIEREQVDPRDLPPDGAVSPADPAAGHRHSHGTRPPTSAEQAIGTSRQRISDSRDRITRAHSAGPPDPEDAPSPGSKS